MYCLRNMNSFRVSNEIIVTFYLSAICGVWSYCLTGWGGNALKRDNKMIDRLVRKVGRMKGLCLQLVDYLYQQRVTGLFSRILDDNSHPLYSLDQGAPERFSRLILPGLYLQNPAHPTLMTVRGSIHTVHVHVHCVHCVCTVCRRLQFLKYFIVSNGCDIMYIFKRGSHFTIYCLGFPL